MIFLIYKLFYRYIYWPANNSSILSILLYQSNADPGVCIGLDLLSLIRIEYT